MEQIVDIEKFDKLQEIFIIELIQQIRFKLAQGGVSGDQLKDLTGEIAFSVASTIDDNAMIESDGIEVHPYLAFGEGDDIIHCGENSYGHELVASLIDRVFKD